MKNKLLSEGGYGCVYYPSVGCIPPVKKQNLQHQKKFVSKIERYDRVTKNEIFIGDMIKYIKNYKAYFAPVVKHCKTFQLSQLKDNQFESCSILSKRSKENRFILVESRYVGKLTFFNYMRTAINNKELVLNIISTYSHLLTSIIKLLSINVIHYDLKAENIVFDTKQNIPIVIDFGLSIFLKNVKKSNLSQVFYVYAPDYYIWSPEIHFLCYLVQKNPTPSRREITDIAELVVKKNVSLNYLYSKSFLHRYTADLKHYLLTFHGKTPYEVYTMILPYSNTWDNFSVSMTYMRVLHYLNMDGFADNAFIIYFSKLLLQNAHPNPKRRLTPTQTIKLFDKYFYTHNINAERDYKQLLYSLAKNKSAVASQITTDEHNLNVVLSSERH